MKKMPTQSPATSTTSGEVTLGLPDRSDVSRIRQTDLLFPVSDGSRSHQYSSHCSAAAPGAVVNSKESISLLEWRNWQTHGTQNPASFTGYEGSTPSSSTSPVTVELGGSPSSRAASVNREAPPRGGSLRPRSDDSS